MTTRTRHLRHTHRYELDDIELATDVWAFVTLECRYSVTPGEARVNYYADGSGYPGSGPELDSLEYDVVLVNSGDDCTNWTPQEIAARQAELKAAVEKWLDEPGTSRRDRMEEELIEAAEDGDNHADD